MVKHLYCVVVCLCLIYAVRGTITLIQAISIVPLQVHYYSEALPATARKLCRSFTPKRCIQLRVKDLPKVSTWRDLNPQPFGRMAPNLPMSHRATYINVRIHYNWWTTELHFCTSSFFSEPKGFLCLLCCLATEFVFIGEVQFLHFKTCLYLLRQTCFWLMLMSFFRLQQLSMVLSTSVEFCLTLSPCAVDSLSPTDCLHQPSPLFPFCRHIS